jgi:Aldo/keto reductase family
LRRGRLQLSGPWILSAFLGHGQFLKEDSKRQDTLSELIMSTRRKFLQSASAMGIVGISEATPSHTGHTTVAPSKPGRIDMCNIPHTDLTVSRLAYGSALVLDWNEEALSESDITKMELLVNTAVDSGINFFDLADFYALSKAEAAFGEVVRRSPGLDLPRFRGQFSVFVAG